MEQNQDMIDQHAPGVKLDAGKEPMRLIMHAMPRALLEVGKVGAHGAEKYSENGWLEVLDGIPRYTDAMFRHALREGIAKLDDESGLLHAAHVAWNALARLELMLRQSSNSEDDRNRRQSETYAYPGSLGALGGRMGKELNTISAGIGVGKSAFAQELGEVISELENS